MSPTQRKMYLATTYDFESIAHIPTPVPLINVPLITFHHSIHGYAEHVLSPGPARSPAVAEAREGHGRSTKHVIRREIERCRHAGDPT